MPKQTKHGGFQVLEVSRSDYGAAQQHDADEWLRVPRCILHTVRLRDTVSIFRRHNAGS